jgi:NADPH:quinone reductase-like Zn-dependent oxidoreductase
MVVGQSITIASYSNSTYDIPLPGVLGSDRTIVTVGPGLSRMSNNMMQSGIDPERKLMKAIIWTQYGSPDVLQLGEVEKPAPKANEVLIKVQATTVTAGDCEMRSLTLPFPLQLPVRFYLGLAKPKRMKILGQEFAGEIESVGKDAKLFETGDKVFGAVGFGMGTYAEYICMPEQPEQVEGVVTLKPANMTYDEAAVVPVGGLNALYFLRKGNIQSGEKVLINGAGGSIGTIAIQLAKSFGAEVTCVDSTGKLAMLQSIGADRVIDYTQEDFASSGQTYDVILDLVGRDSFSRCIRSLKTKGVYLQGNPSLLGNVRGLWSSTTSSKRVIDGTVSYKTEDLIFLKKRIEAGKLKSVIDRRYPLEQTAEAHRYIETGDKKGNVVISFF